MQFRDIFATRRQLSPLETSPYTEELVQLLARRYGIGPGEQGACVGVASARLPRLFLEHGHKLVATAATPEASRALDSLAEHWPTLRVVAGTADESNLPRASVDFVVAERVLYQPDLAAVREEFRRILRPGGVVVVITDNRVYGGSAQQEAYERLLRTHCADFQKKVVPASVAPKVAELFGGAEVFEDAFVGSNALSLEQLIEQTTCMPIAPHAAHPEHAPMLRALERFFSDWSSGGLLAVPVVCRVACGRLVTKF